MKIAYAGDWHANKHWATIAIQYARENGAEHILHLGDFGYDFSPGFRNAVELALSQAHINLWFVDGNHENFNWLYGQKAFDDGRRPISKHVYHLPRGYQWNWNGNQFMAVGGAYSVDRKWREENISYWLDEEITDEEVEKACAGERADILISHDCPTGAIIPGIDDSEPNTMFPAWAIAAAQQHRGQLRKMVDVIQPKEIWHGHYHRRYDTLANFGYGSVDVHGLDMDATRLEDNVVVVELPDR